MHDTPPGLTLKKIRQENGLSLRRVAEISGYATSYLSEIESGRKTPAPFALGCIVKAAAEPSQQDGIYFAFVKEWSGRPC